MDDKAPIKYCVYCGSPAWNVKRKGTITQVTGIHSIGTDASWKLDERWMNIEEDITSEEVECRGCHKNTTYPYEIRGLAFKWL